MRVNTRDCLAALKRGKAYRAASGAVHTDGRVIRSYGVVIATPDPNDMSGLVRLVTCEKYSQTTTVQTNGVAVGLKAYGFEVRLVDQVAVDRAAGWYEKFQPRAGRSIRT